MKRSLFFFFHKAYNHQKRDRLVIHVDGLQLTKSHVPLTMLTPDVL